jgi:hypothetical protein
VAEVFADDSAVFGLHQTIVVTLPGTAFRLLNQLLIEQFGDGGVDELALLSEWKPLIFSKPNFSASYTLIFNPQHDCSFKLISYWNQS